VSIESRIDIVVKNLNQLNKLADNLKNINKTNEKLVKGLDRIESQLNKINTNGVAFKKISKDARDASKEVNNLGSRIADIISNNKGGIGNFGLGMLGAGAISGITKITDGFKNLVPAVNAVTSKIPVLGEKLQIVQQQATGFDAVFDGILHGIASHPGLWGAAAVAITVFGGKLPVVAKGAKALWNGLNGVGQAVTNNIIGKLVPATKHLVDMRVALVDVREQMENMTRGASLEELNIMVGMARKEMESFWHMTGKAEDAAIKLAVAMAAQRKEQTAINDLLFKAQGKATTAEQADNKRALDAQKQKSTHSFDMFSTEAKQLEILQRKNKLFIDSAGQYQRLVEKGGKMLDIEQRIERVMNRRKKGFGGAGGMGGKGGENLMLGAGFPLLFGGGVGSVAGGVGGALLGNMTGAGGFGMQILGSAIGTMMDTAIQKAAKLGESLKSINMNDLVESGVRLSGELQSQVTHLQKIGQIEQARALLAAQVMDQTGASAGVLGDINNMTNILKATWNDLVGAVGAFLGVLAGPLVTALAGVLKIVTEILKLFNRGISAIREWARAVAERFAPGLVEAIDNAMDNLNVGLQEALGKADQLARKLDLDADTLMTKRTLREGITSGGSFEAQRRNAEIQKSMSMIDLRKSRTAELEATDPATRTKSFMEGFKGVTREMQLDIEGKYAKEIENIDAKEQKLIAKLERQNELKAALFGIDQKIAQARADEDKELEFRLNAQKEIASITSKLMEDTAGKDDAEKERKIEDAKLGIAKVNFALQTKIKEFRKEEEKEAKDVIADLQKQNDLLQGKIDGNEDEITQQQTIEKILDKIGIKYKDQVTALVKKNGELTKEAENAQRLEKLWESIKDTVASGLTDAIMGLIEGTKSLGESLAGIAKQIASMAIKSALLDVLPFAEGGYARNGIKAFSSGGIATRPTLGLVGEAGEDEYIIPASKMASSMQRYSAGARGESVIPGTGSSYASGGAGGSTTVNYSGPILNFNSEEFVPKSAIGQIINSAAARGAKAGEARTLSSLQNSRSRRQNIGL